MASRVTWAGLSELRAALRSLPSDLKEESANVVQGAANGAAVTVRTVYGQHAVSGRLRDSVTVTPESAGQFGVSYVVKSSSHLAWLFDNGSQARHYTTASGARHATGKMWGKTPPTHVFVRTMIQKRRQMYTALEGVLTRAGLKVTRDAR